MDNGMEGMLDTYLYEVGTLLDQLDEMLVADEKAGSFSQDDINEIFRIMHTIKGSSAMMEFHSLTTIAHRMEDLFFYIRDKGGDALSPEQKKELFDLMFRSEDCLRSETGKVERGEPLTESVDGLVNEISAFLSHISGSSQKEEQKEGTGPAAAETAAKPAQLSFPEDTARFFIRVFLDEGIGMENLRAFMIVNSLRECDVQVRSYPADMESNPETCSSIIENGFFLAFDTKEAEKKAVGILQGQSHIRSYEELESPEPEPEARPPKESQGTETPSQTASPSQPPKAAREASHAPVKQSLISVNLQKLDQLINIVGEIVITESMVSSSPELSMLPAGSYDNYMKSARQLRKLTDDLQDVALSLRMVPISGVFQKMNRIVRDMKNSLGKDVRLTIIGEETEVDKTVVDGIQDPIMHMVRNCMDHGIEDDAAKRTALGKDPQGEIVLSAAHTSNEVVITVSDDGRGMDPEVLLKKAGEKGLLTKPASEYSKKEALSLIMLPGFSTNQQVTEYSGRGVGMDVVKKNVEAVGGIISLDSEPGRGTTISLRIPLTLSIVDGMKMKVGSSIFTIPISSIRQSFKIRRESLLQDELGNEMVECMDNFYPIVRLHKLYQLETSVTDIEEGILIWVESSDRSFCLFADDLIGQQQVVLKPFPAYLNRFDLKNYGISGCTILGDGNISIILDVLNLYHAAMESRA